MKTKFSLTLAIVTLIVLNLHAQKRNNIKLGFTFDNMFRTDIYSVEFYSNKFGYALGYDRNIGSHISIGVSGNVYFSGNSSIDDFSADKYSPAYYTNYTFRKCDFTQSGYILGYESKYYFQSFDDDGPNSGYIGICIQTGNFNQHITDVTYYNRVTYKNEIKPFNDQTLTVNRIGIKLGRAFSTALSGDFYVSLMYNMNNSTNQQFNSPTIVRSLSFGVGYAFGVPF